MQKMLASSWARILSLALPLSITLGAGSAFADCIAPPNGLVGWWRAETNAYNQVNGTSGVLSNGVTFASGEVGSAFSFNGSNSFVEVPDSPALRLTNELTIEFWLKRQRFVPEVALEKGGDLTGGTENYGISLHDSSDNYVLEFVCKGGGWGAGRLSDTNWHHCAVTAHQGASAPIIYIDGVSQPITYHYGVDNPINLYPSTRPLHIGAQVDPVSGYSYFSKTLIDELSLYTRALSAAEIQSIFNAGSAGKCFQSAPAIVSQPMDQTVHAGGDAVFTASATGTTPLAYQWIFNGGPLHGATNSVLTLADVQPTQAGTYALLVTNVVGAALSSNATLTVLSDAPSIVVQPASQTVLVGSDVSLSVSVTGTPPFSYQWSYNGSPVSNWTNAVLLLPSVQTNQAGVYAVSVANLAGTTTSSNAVLHVTPVGTCAPPPGGMVAWWRAESNASNQVDGTSANLSNGVSFVSGVVGSAFSFNGSNSFVEVPDSPALRFTNEVTIEFWLKRERFVPEVALEKGGDPTGGTENYGISLHDASDNYVMEFVCKGGGWGAGKLSDMNWHHCAVTARQGDAAPTIYIDGVSQPITYHFGGAVAVNLYPSTRPLHIGAQVDPASGWYYYSKTLMDEVSLYNRALSAAEIQSIFAAGNSGKCLQSAPSIVLQPVDQTVHSGTNVTFAVNAAGTAPLVYQWTFNGGAIAGATSSSLTLGHVQPAQSGIYAVEITNAFGAALSSNATLTVLADPPTILVQPLSQTVQAGTNVILRVSAAGSSPLVYQWGFNGSELVDATNSILILTNIQPAQAGTYVVEVTNIYGVATSSNAVVTVLSRPPSIVIQPASRTVQEGTDVSFSVSVSGTPPFSYQWSYNGAPVLDWTNAILLLPAIHTNQAGIYAVTVANSAGTATSSNAVLHVTPVGGPCTPPPAGIAAWWRAEGNANNQVNGANGFLSNGVSFVSGVVGSAFSFNGSNSFVEVPDSPALRFTNEVTIEFWLKRERFVPEVALEKGGDPTGGTENYGISLHDASDNYVMEFVCKGGGWGAGKLSDTNWHHCALTARQGDSAPTIYIDGVSQPITYHFGGAVAVNLYPSTRPLHIGAQVDPVSGWYYYSKTLMDEVSLYNRALSAAEIQSVFTAGSAGKCTQSSPFIVAQPVNQTVHAGTNVTFSVSVAGSAPLAYQWLFNGGAISGATGSLLTLGHVQPAQSGIYAVQVTNAFGAALSSNATLTVLADPPSILVQPVSQTVEAGSDVNLSVSVSGTPPFSFQWSYNGTPVSDWTNAVLLLPAIQTNQAGIYAVSVANSAGTATSSNAVLHVISVGPCTPPPPGIVAWWRAEGNAMDFSGANNGFLSNGVAFVSGRVGNAFSFNGSNSFVEVPDSPALRLTNAVTIEFWLQRHRLVPEVALEKGGDPTGGVENYGISLHGSSDNYCLEFVCGGSGWGAGQLKDFNWHHVAVTAVNGAAAPTIYIDGAVQTISYHFGSTSAVHLYPSQRPLHIGAQVDPVTGWYYFSQTCIDELALYSRALSSAEIGGIYASGSDGKCTAPVAPMIVSQPVGQTQVVGGVALFSVQASGSSPLSFQWLFDGTAIIDATNSSLVLTNLQSSQAGDYSVTVANSVASVTSSNATLVVNVVPPSITTQPLSQTVVGRSSASFSVVATGSLPLSFAWQFNGVAIPGATDSSLVLTNIQLSQAGNYSVVVTNAGGTANSSNAVLVVQTPTALVEVIPPVGASGGANVSVPVVLLANGNENALSFSLKFDPSLLTFASLSLGADAGSATLLANTSQASAGTVAVLLGLPPDTNFVAGTAEVLRLNFVASLVTTDALTSVSFTGQPIASRVTDSSGTSLPATFAGASIPVAAAQLEGDVSGRPNGDHDVTVNDWVLEGRYVARLDFPTNASEFSRADCAPRSTQGDGEISVSDWVQVGRYAAHLDPWEVAGGPLTEGPLVRIGKRDNSSRVVQVGSAALYQAQTTTLPVSLVAQGNENAVGVSLTFDPNVLSFSSASLGAGSSGATLYVNSGQAAAGRLGLALALGTGSSFPAGTQEVARVTFKATTASSGNTSISLTNVPVPCEVSDANATPLTVVPISGTITVNPLPAITLASSGGNVTLSWPGWATNFVLQSTSGDLSGHVTWTTLPVSPVSIGNSLSITVPIDGPARFYRLAKP